MRFLAIVLLFLLPVMASALEITGLQVDRTENGEHVLIHLNAHTEYDVFMADNPTRLVVDIGRAHWKGKVWSPRDYDGNLIQGLRFGQHNQYTSRMVMDLADDTEFGNVTLSYEKNYYLLEFDLFGNVSRVTSAKKPKSSKAGKSRGHEKPSEEKATTEKPMAEKASGGNNKPTIIIDPGHGGQDDGTSGYSGSKEKNLTLKYAKALKEALLETGRYHVVLTRTDDRYLLLSERVKRAREAHGNLFISIHADSSSDEDASGLSVYTISEKASDKQSAALAEKENKADIIGGMDLSDTTQDVADILIDLTQRETRAKSNKFAAILVKNFGRAVPLLIHTHRQAGFAVLKAPDIPSVLIEVGFLTNPDEERELKSKAHEEKFLHGVIKSADKYFSR